MAELLIALVVLGVIFALTIPKVLQSQNTGRYNAAAKDVMLTIDGAYKAYMMENTAGAATRGSDLTPYIDYVRVDTTTVIDDNPTDGTGLACSSTAWDCLQLFDGGILLYPKISNHSFGNTYATNGTWFQFDPDGKNLNVNTVDGPGKGLEFWLYYNGNIRTRSTINSATCTQNGCFNPVSNADPSWFSWN